LTESQNPIVTFRDITRGLRQLGLDSRRPVIAHASLAAFGEVRGGAEAVLGAILGEVGGLLMPTFTFKTMLTPETGPDHNGITYGSGSSTNRMAEFYRADMPADRLMGIVPETLRRLPGAFRSMHPILSFSGINVMAALHAQTLAEPLAPIQSLHDQDGWVMLMGVDQSVNTSIHFAERLAGRKQFIRWGLTPEGVRQCPGFPGCSDGFEALNPALEGISRSTRIGAALVQVIPLVGLVKIVKSCLEKDPLALLCSRLDCERCNAARCCTTARCTY
jgi:aminoglycoside 3-N-acetyltransferase